MAGNEVLRDLLDQAASANPNWPGYDTLQNSYLQTMWSSIGEAVASYMEEGAAHDGVIEEAVAATIAAIPSITVAKYNPSITDGASRGHTHGSLWVNPNRRTAFICLSPRDKKAYWLNLSAGAANTGDTGAYPDYHKVPTYATGNLTQMDTYLSPALIVQLASTVFTYTTGQLTQVVTTDLVSGAVITKVLAYTGANLTSVTKTTI